MATPKKRIPVNDGVVREHVLDDATLPDEALAVTPPAAPLTLEDDPVEAAGAWVGARLVADPDVTAALLARVAELEAQLAAPAPAKSTQVDSAPKRPGSAHRQPLSNQEMQAMAAHGGAYVARRDLTYNGRTFDRGQVIELTGARNDAKMIGYGYVGELDRRADLYTCAVCGGEFIGMAERASHAKFRHPAGELSAMDEDRALDAREAMLASTAPLTIPGPNLTNI